MARFIIQGKKRLSGTIRPAGNKNAVLPMLAASVLTDQPLVLLVAENVGKVLGNYITEWGALPLNLVVVDEIAAPRAQYVRIGRLHKQVVPVSFYGLHD